MAVPSSPQVKLDTIRRKSFRDQAIWFLNSSEAGDDPVSCELVRSMEEKCTSIEKKNSVVDEFTAHRILEQVSKKPCTSNQLRKFMETISKGPLQSERARRISLAELLIYQFGYDCWQMMANRPECCDILAERDARDELEKAQSELNKLTEAAKLAAQAAEDAHQSEEKALRQELAAAKSAENAVTAKVALDETREKVSSALEALELQEESTRRKIDQLEGVASDGNKGIVTRNKAKAELAILFSDDPIMLRTARIHQEAALKKMTAAAKKAEETVALAEANHERATHARKEAIRLKTCALAATKKAEEAIPSAQAAFDKVSGTLDEIVKKEKTGRGSIFFMHADLNQSRKYLPKSRFVVAQKRVDDIVGLTR